MKSFACISMCVLELPLPAAPSVSARLMLPKDSQRIYQSLYRTAQRRPAMRAGLSSRQRHESEPVRVDDGHVLVPTTFLSGGPLISGVACLLDTDITVARFAILGCRTGWSCFLVSRCGVATNHTNGPRKDWGNVLWPLSPNMSAVSNGICRIWKQQ